MNVASACGYYSDFAVKATGVARPRSPPFWEAFMFCWAVKSGEYHREFFIDKANGQLSITKDNFHLVRPTFGEWAARKLPTFAKGPLLIIPVPNKVAPDATTYASLEMVREAFKDTEYSDSALDALRWNKKLPKAHEGGPRKRADLLPLLDVRPEAKPALDGKQLVLIDDLVTTGGSLLACGDKLTEIGATVLGAITCGRAVYDLAEPPFGSREFELTTELSDYRS
jgi:predicted amidophosphoribosyltransferase